MSETPEGPSSGHGRSVELIDHLRSRWGVLLVVAPVLAGSLAFVAVEPAERHEALGIVSVTAPDAIESSQFSTGPFVADFRRMLASAPVEESVDEALAAVGAEWYGEVSVTAGVSGGALVEVGIEASTAAAAELAVRTAVAEGLAALNRQNVARAQVVADARRADVDEASTALDEFASTHGVVDVEMEYARRSADLLETRNAAVADPSNAALQTLLTEKAAELDQYGELLIEWRLLDGSLAAAADASVAAEAALGLAVARAEDAAGGGAIESVTVEQASGVIGRALAGLVGAAVAFAVVAAVMLVGRARRHRGRRAASPTARSRSAGGPRTRAPQASGGPRPGGREQRRDAPSKAAAPGPSGPKAPAATRAPAASGSSGRAAPAESASPSGKAARRAARAISGPGASTRAEAGSTARDARAHDER